MTINYYSLGPDKRMCDVVFAGSHDAGISEGGAPTKAQSDTIETQAGHGARFFDVRVGAFLSEHKIKLKTFHAAEKLQFNKTKDYTLSGQNLNTKTLQQLSGHVLCVYTETSVLDLEQESYARHARATGPRFEMKNVFKGTCSKAAVTNINSTASSIMERAG